MFRAAYCSSSGVTNCICSLWFIYPCGDRPLSRLGGKWGVPTQPGQQFGAPDDERFCRSKHVEPSINFGIINSITSCILLVFLLRKLIIIYLRGFKLRAIRTEVRIVVFWVIRQRVVVIPYRRFGITYLSHLRGSSILENGTESCSETSVRNCNFSLLTTQKRADLIYFPAET